MQAIPIIRRKKLKTISLLITSVNFSWIISRNQIKGGEKDSGSPKIKKEISS